MVKELLKNDVFIVTIGYNAVAYAKAGFMTQEATKTYAGEKSCSVLKTIVEAGDLKDQSHLGDPQILDIMPKTNKRAF